jgi:hypothetical protein
MELSTKEPPKATSEVELPVEVVGGAEAHMH